MCCGGGGEQRRAKDDVGVGDGDGDWTLELGSDAEKGRATRLCDGDHGGAAVVVVALPLASSALW